jgi:hypothetical protein
MVTLLPATNVNVSVLVSATTDDSVLATAMVVNTFCVTLGAVLVMVKVLLNAVGVMLMPVLAVKCESVIQGCRSDGHC